jgi:hypothetical protein
MIHAHVWLKKLLVDVGVQYSNKPLEAIIKEAQLDAFKAGMTRAAETCKKQNSNTDYGYGLGCSQCEQAILTERDNLKEQNI